MRTLVALIVGAIILAAAFAATAPATLLAEPLASSTQRRLSLADASGSVWHGRGQLVVTGASFATPVEWHVSPLGLAFGEIRGTLLTDAASSPASFAIGR